MCYLAGLCQAHAHSEACRHARREGCRQRAAQAWIDHPDTSDHRLHDQLTAELFDAVHLLTHLSAVTQQVKVQEHSLLHRAHASGHMMLLTS